jgi:selenocysteine lyase/cysteine desulfurase
MQPAAPRGYQGFGSFFSDNVEELVAQPEERYVPPPLPFAVDDLFDELEHAPQLEFGAAARPHFLVDFARWTFVNHGAFGAAARVPFEVAQRWRVHCEAQPLTHIDRELFAHVVLGIRHVARALNAAPTDVVFTPNATAALNAVIRSAPLAPGDAVYSLSVCYGSVKTMLRVRAAEAGAQFVDAELRFPLAAGDADVLALVERTLPANAKLAVFDAVTSNTALVLPIAQLARLCLARCPDIRILVDAAHSLGAHFPLDVPALGVHFWVSNCHKHLCSPRGAAVLWAHPAYRATLRPLVVSHGAGAGFTSDFMWDGCRDYSPALAVTHTLRWWRAIGERRAGAYVTATLAAGVAALLARWQTHTLVPLTLCSNMALVCLPADAPPGAGAAMPAPPATADAAELLQRQPPICDGSCTSADAKEWQDWLHFRAAVEVPVKCIQGCLYVRITAHIYNEARDYEVLADAVARALGWPT